MHIQIYKSLTCAKECMLSPESRKIKCRKLISVNITLLLKNDVKGVQNILKNVFSKLLISSFRPYAYF